jgi:2-oxoglutarate dehydrogenase complex dehydrogenase (E1) component-like enzyme
VIDDPRVSGPDAAKIDRALLCSGKVYYDLAAHREAVKREDVAIIRIEQLYPFPERALKDVFDRYPNLSEVVWVQEEPRNMGAWRFAQAMLKERLDIEVTYIGRESKPSPAVASEKMHKQEQEKIMITALGLPGGEPRATRPKSGSVKARLKTQQEPIGERRS